MYVKIARTYIHIHTLDSAMYIYMRKRESYEFHTDDPIPI